MRKVLLLLVLTVAVSVTAPVSGKKYKPAKMDKTEFLEFLDATSSYDPDYIPSEIPERDVKSFCKVYHKSNYYYVLARLNYARKDYKVAAAYVDSAIMVHSSKAYVDMPMLERVKFLLAVKNVAPAKVVSVVDTYLATHSGFTPAYQERAEAYVKMGDTTRAIEDYRTIIELSDTACVPYAKMAQLMTSQGNKSEALKLLNDCYQIDSAKFQTYPVLYKLRSHLYHKMGEGKKAIDDMLDFAIANNLINLMDFEQIIKQNLHYVAAAAIKKANENYGDEKLFMQWIATRAYDWAKLYKETAQLTEKMFEQNNYYSKDLCFAYYDLGLYEDAIKFGEFFEEHYGDNNPEISTLGAIGGAYHALGQYEKAIEYYTMAYERQPMKPVFQQMKATTYLHMNDTLNAMKYFKAALELNPQDTVSLFFRGVTYKIMGQPEKANADFQKFLAFSPIGINYMLVQCYLGNEERAIAICDSLLQAEPFDCDIQLGASGLYSNLNEKAKALAFLKKGLEYGYRNFEHLEWDFDLDNIKATPEFKALIEEFKAKPLYVPRAKLPYYDEDDSDNIKVEPLLI